MTRSTLDEASRWALTDEMTYLPTSAAAMSPDERYALRHPHLRGEDDNDWYDDDFEPDLFGAEEDLRLYRLDPSFTRAHSPRSTYKRAADTLCRLGDAAYALAERTARRA